MIKLNESTLLMDGGGFRYDPSCWEPTVELFVRSTEVEREQFRLAACAMQYKRYLRTVYWGVIRGKMLSTHTFCGNCRSRTSLQINHLTYAHRGEEYNFLDDLEVLCGSCHQGRHGLATIEQVARSQRRRMNAWSSQYTGEGNALRPAVLQVPHILEKIEDLL